MNEFLDQMGRRITARRKELGLTQEQLSEIVNLSEQTISTAECGKKALRPENIAKLSIALDCTTDFLLMGTEVPYVSDMTNRTVKNLTPLQYQCLNCIIDNFLLAINSKN